MALEKGRNLFKNMSEPLVARLEGVNPATLTWLTLPTGLAAAWLMMCAGEGNEGALMFLGAAFLMATAMALDGLDGLVNNGAIATGIGGPTMTEIETEVWDRVMAVNVRGTWLMSKAAVPHLAHSGSGKIVNLASDTALWGAPRLMHYVASKGAVLSMTRSMARELGASGIAVNSIAPGLTAVEATEYVPQDRKALYVENRPFNRTQMPNDVTGAVLFLVSDAASFITGQCIPVNGGFVMR